MTVRPGVRALRATPADAPGEAHVVELDDGTDASGAMRCCWPSGASFPIDDLGLEHYDVDTTGRTPYPARRAAARRRRALDRRRPRGPGAAHPPGPLPGRAGRPDGPRRGRSSPTTARCRGPRTPIPRPPSVGRTLDEARADGHRRLRARRRLPEDRQGLLGRGDDRPPDDRGGPRHPPARGAAMACPDASAAIHECVLAIKARVPVDVLAETIHAFPSTSRILNGLFADAPPRARPPGERGQGLGARRRPRRRGRPATGERSRGRRPARPGRRGRPPGRPRRRRADPGRAGRDRPRRAVTAASTAFARSARSRVIASSGPNGGVPAGQRGSSRRTAQREPGPRDRWPRPARRCRTP